jgi:hypothetical protein
MTVSVSKPALNLREELSALKKPSGIKGEELLRANNASDVYGVIGQNKNMIINGAMNIAQRGTSQALASGQNGYYTVDRFGHQNGGFTGVMTVTYSQVADGPPGFDYSAKMAIGATAHTGALSATSYAGWYQVIEGYDCQRLGWGTTNAKPLTISFWVKSSVAGNYPHVGIRYDSTSGTASNFFNFSINAANAWEYKTVTIPASPYLLSNKTNGGGIQVHINPLAGVGSAGTPIPGAWALANCLGTQAHVNSLAWIGVPNATFQITGVQAEVGAVATPFEYRPHQQELALCQRYYWTTGSSPTSYAHFCTAYFASTTSVEGTIQYPQTMRAVPTITFSATNTFMADGASSLTPSAIQGYFATPTTARIQLTVTGGTAGQGTAIGSQGGGAAQIYYSAEL